MRRVGILEPRVSRIGEPQAILWAASRAHVDRQGRLKVQIVRMESQDSKHPCKACEITVDDSLQVRRSPTPPVFELLTRQQIHPDQHIDGHHDLSASEDIVRRVHNTDVERIQAISCNGGVWHHRYEKCRQWAVDSQAFALATA